MQSTVKQIGRLVAHVSSTIHLMNRFYSEINKKQQMKTDHVSLPSQKLGQAGPYTISNHYCF
jgi:hypothetical protein